MATDIVYFRIDALTLTPIHESEINTDDDENNNFLQLFNFNNERNLKQVIKLDLDEDA